MMKLSIVVPVYGVEETLPRCVESILSQAYDDYELILVDDGSPDGSGALCDHYATIDPRVMVVHQANGGLSSARNKGISLSTGDYLTFIDSDDYIGENTLSVLMSRLEAHPDYDMLEYPIYWHHGSPEATLLKFGAHSFDDMTDYWLSCKAYTHTYACNKVFARRLFDGVRFVEGRKFEDAHTLPLLLKRARLVCTTDDGMYYYTCNPSGITMNPGAAGMRDLLEAHVTQLGRLGLDGELTEYFTHVLNIQLDAYTASSDTLLLPTPPLPLHAILTLGVGWKSKVKLIMLKLLGMKNLCKLHRLFHR